jgi:selenocysteine-specific elongation factor
MPVTVGTAGHIDHGKTWLVRALTGKDTDRLPEEQARGISIDLGYAPLDSRTAAALARSTCRPRALRAQHGRRRERHRPLPARRRRGEGARPQTHEHLAIIRLLGIEHGVVAITKADAVEPDLVELVARRRASSCPARASSPRARRPARASTSCAAALGAAADRVPRSARGPTRLFVDRVFTLAGIGTVVTGTLWSGSIGEGDVLRAEPAGLDVRVRSVQVHDRPVERAEAGQRVAVALPGVERRELRRGDALVAPGPTPPRTAGRRARRARADRRRDAPARPPRDGRALRARRPRRERWAQLRLASPAVAARGDRVVLRDRTTSGAGSCSTPRLPATQARSASSSSSAATSRARPRARPRETLGHLGGEPNGLEQAGELGLLTGLARGAPRRPAGRIEAADPLDPGIPAPPSPGRSDVLPLAGVERAGRGSTFPARWRASASARGGRGSSRPSSPQAVSRRRRRGPRARVFLEREGRLVRLGDGLALGAAAYDEAKRLLLEECESGGSITLARFRDLLGTGRKPAQLLLERFDADGLTRRVGDERVLRRRATTA